MPTVTVARVVSAPLEDVWTRIGDWSDPTWLPGVTLKSVDGNTRVLRIPPDVQLTETRVASNAHSLTWRTADDSPLPVTDYTATLSAESLGDGTRVTWVADYTPDGASEAAASAVLTQMLHSMLLAV